MLQVKSGVRTVPPLLFYEQALWEAGYSSIAGVDEAGRGALAGPVVAAAVILPSQPDVAEKLFGVRDSKQMTALGRERWRRVICQLAVSWAVGFASHEEIDRIGILPATRLAACRAIEQLVPGPDYLITDYLIFSELEQPQTGLIKGDQLVLSVSCASILAKTARDHSMVEAGDLYPGYGFERHKGYGTREHRKALMQLGYTPLHRLTFQCSLDDLQAEETVTEVNE